MPEYGESWISQLLIYLWMLWMLSVGGTLDILNIWIDATDTEQASFPVGSRAREGHVYPIDDTSTVIRGQRNSQRPIYPPMYAKSGVPLSARGLRLQAVQFAARNVIMGFGPLWVQVQLFTHTNAQIYTKDDWNAVCAVNKKDRKFRVGFALEFEKYVVAFVTMDNLIATHWAPTREMLPASAVDVFDDFYGFLETVASWMQSRRSAKGSMTAMNAVRQALVPGTNNQKVFPGLGVYTVNEVWHIAGLSPDLSERDLIHGDPSYAARLVLGYLEVAIDARENLWKFVQPSVHDWVIAASVEQRLRYPDRLYVYGKDRVRMSSRQADLLAKYEQNPKFNVFEPSLISRALKREDVNLGHLVFGHDAWGHLLVAAGINFKRTADDPLSRYFAKFNQIASGASLNLDVYTSELFVTRLTATWRHTHLYRSKGGKSNVWSAIPSGQSCSDLTESSGSEKTKLLLKYVISHTAIWTVGPLDYCGVAKIICAQGSGQDIIAVCENDPRLSPFYQTKRAYSLFKTTRGLNAEPGTARRTTTSLKKAKRKGLPPPNNRKKENKENILGDDEPRKRRRTGLDCFIVSGPLSPRRTRGQRRVDGILSDPLH